MTKIKTQLKAVLEEADFEDLDALWHEIGFCPRCNSLIEHHVNEPFASCGCGTGEDTGEPTFLQRLKHKQSGTYFFRIDRRRTPTAKPRYDDVRKCQNCGGINHVKVTDSLNYTPLEADTECHQCGNKNFWAHGFFISGREDRHEMKGVNNDSLPDISAITNPDYHALNVHTGRNDRLLHAVLAAYIKHHLGREEIGWNQLSDILCSAICEAAGDDAFCDWLERIDPQD